MLHNKRLLLCSTLVFLFTGMGILCILAVGHFFNPPGAAGVYWRIAALTLAGAVAGALSFFLFAYRFVGKVCDINESLETLFDGADDFIFIVEPGGRLLHFNRALSGRLGYRQEVLSDSSVFDLFPCETRQRVEELFREVVTGKTKTTDIPLLAGDGGIVPAESKVSRGRWNGKDAFFFIARDISGRKALEEQLVQAQKMEAVGMLAGGIAHDFNNILTAIMGYGYFMSTKMAENDPLRRHAEQVVKSSEKAAELVKGLLAFSRRQTMTLRPVDLNQIVRRTETLLSRIIGEDIELKTELSAEILLVMADANQIEQVLMNLATNARDAMPEGGRLTIRTGHAKTINSFVREDGHGKPVEYACISVSDSGKGIGEENLKRIFEPFFTTKEVGKGTGLGLAIAYGIVKQHNGCVDVESATDKGTTFRVCLPLIETAVVNTEVSEPVMPQGGSETILLVEDNDVVRYLINDLFTDSGYTVIMAADGEEALVKFEKFRDEINLLVLDVVLPKKNGKEIRDEIRKLSPGMKAIFLSGYAEEFIISKGIPVSGEIVVKKPVSPVLLLGKVREVLDGAGK
jgi:PAS domain S-box-containing protein